MVLYCTEVKQKKVFYWPRSAATRSINNRFGWPRCNKYHFQGVTYVILLPEPTGFSTIQWSVSVYCVQNTPAHPLYRVDSCTWPLPLTSGHTNFSTTLLTHKFDKIFVIVVWQTRQAPGGCCKCITTHRS